MAHDHLGLPVHLAQRRLQGGSVSGTTRELVSRGIVTIFCVGEIDVDDAVQEPQRLDALVSTAVPHHGQRKAVLCGDCEPFQQHRQDMRGRDEVRVRGPGLLQIEEDRGELRGRSAHRIAPLQRERPGLAGLAGEVAACDQDHPGWNQLGLFSVMDPGAGERKPVVLLADAGRARGPIDAAEMGAEIAARVVPAGFRGAKAQLLGREPHVGLIWPRGTTNSAPPEMQRSCPMQCEEASLASQSAALTTSSTSATR